MGEKQIWFALVVGCLLTGSTIAQGDFFFSLTESGPNIDQTRNFKVGDSGSLFIYWSTNGPADSDLSVGAFIDVFTDTSGVIEFTAAETFDYEINVGGVPIGNRLLDQLGGGGSVGPPSDLSADLIDELASFTITGGPGILESNNGSAAFLDSGYDANNDAFNWGRIDFYVVGNGRTKITGMPGDGSIVNGGQVIGDIVTFTTATIIVVPEPTGASLLLIGCLACLSRRGRPVS